MPLLIFPDGRRKRFSWEPRPPGVGEPQVLFGDTSKPCWCCVSFVGLDVAGHAYCRNRTCAVVRSSPWLGCAAFERSQQARSPTRMPEFVIRIDWAASVPTDAIS